MLKHLVTGSSGFIGTHLCKALIGRGDTVQHADKKAMVSCEEIIGKVSLADVKMIWHLAGVEGTFKLQPLAKIIEQEVKNMEVVLRACFQVDGHLVVFSSMEVYAPSPVVSNGFNARTPYRIAKLAAETMALATGYPEVTVLRLGSVAGKGQDPAGGAVLARFADQGRRGQNLTLFGTGKEKRCFIHVRDVVAACMTLRENWKPGVYDVINPKNTTTLKNLARLVATQMGVTTNQVRPSDLGLEHYFESEAPVEEITGGIPGWKPKVGLKEIIQDVLS